MNRIHLFYLGSYSHLIIADGIIREKELPLDSIYFVTYRGVRLPKCYEGNLLYDEGAVGNRKKYFLINYFKFRRIFYGKKVCGYFPFQQEFPVKKFYDEYVFFEEGLSAYDSSLDFKFNKGLFVKSYIKQSVISFLSNKIISGLYNGKFNGSPFPFECTLIGLTENSYKNFSINQAKREVIHLPSKPLNPSSIKDSVIIVMDSTHASDRMESADNYLKILSDVLKNYDFNSRKIYLKLHPDNYRDLEDGASLINKYLGFLDYQVIDESLEDIALSNQNNTFIGNHSTILFYAPIYGNTNKAISFARIEAERDAVYTKWLDRWGGVEGSIRLFSQQMECL